MPDPEEKLYFCYACMNTLQAGQMVCPNCGHDNAQLLNEDDLLREGTILNGKFLVGKVLGRGGFGVTYLGFDLSLRIKIAIKEFFPSGLSSRSQQSGRVRPLNSSDSSEVFARGREQFQQEAQTLARFNSPSIVRVREYFQENGTAYIVMDYVSGDGLNEAVLKANGRLSWERVVSLFNPLIREMGKLHSEMVIHRDIKPANIKIQPEYKGDPEHLVLLDFGTARTYIDQATKTYSTQLTPGFAPLEQYRKRSIQGPYTDVYALCATMYACITGVVPPSSLEISFGDAALRPIGEFGIPIPEHIQRAVMHGLGLKVEDRTQTMEDLYRELNTEPVPGQKKALCADLPEEAETVPVMEDPDRTLPASGFPLEENAALKSSVSEVTLPAEPPAEDPKGNAPEIVPHDPPKSRFPILLFLFLFLLALCLGAFFLYRNKQAEKPTIEAASSISEPLAMLDTANLKVGDTFTFGSYEQDNDLNNGTEPIEWQVLAIENGHALVISRYALDAQPYNDSRNDVTWETCTLRKWLNGIFFQSAFTSAEKELILVTRVQNPDNSSSGIKGGNPTADRFFLLSIDEAGDYFSSDTARECKATAYTEKKGVYGIDYSLWWLRSPGHGSDDAACVDDTGFVIRNGLNVDSAIGGVRPAFWLNL